MQLAPDAEVADVVGWLHALDRVEVRRLSVRSADEGRGIEAHLKPEPGVRLDTALADLAERSGVTGLEVE